MSAPLAPEKIVQIQRLRRTTDLTNVEIAEVVGVYPRTVSRHAAKVPLADRAKWSAGPLALTGERQEQLLDRIRNTTDAFYIIGREFGVSGVTVARYASMLPPGSFVKRLSNAEKRVPGEVIEKVIQFAIDGLHHSEIAERVGHHVKTVMSVIRRNRDEIGEAKAEAAAARPVVDPVEAFAGRLYADGWDDGFVKAAVRNFPRLSIAQVAA